jgi:hypothetical protein
MKKLLLISIFFVVLIFPVKILAAGAPVQNNSNYTTPSGPAASDGTSTETVSVHLQDASQNVVSGVSVTLSSSNDSTATFPQNNQITDVNGNATFKIASTTAGDTKISLTDTTNSVVFTDWFTLRFYDAEKGCINNPPSPVLTSVVSNSNNTATVTWKDVSDPVLNYLISYGIQPGKYLYGNTNVGAQGTTSYTIGSLSGNKKYYFVVAANNNCGTGGVSNEMSVVVRPIPATSLPTAKPVPSNVLVNTSTVAPVTVISTDIPIVTEAPHVSVSTGEIDFKILGIGVIGFGILLIIIALVFQKISRR